MSDGRRELPHGGNPVGMGKLHLCIAILPFGLTQGRLSLLLFSQIDHESDGLVTGFLDARYADQRRHAAAILVEIFFLEWLQAPGQFHLIDPLCIAIAPFRSMPRG
jgi:hypothetical protein